MGSVHCGKDYSFEPCGAGFGRGSKENIGSLRVEEVILLDRNDGFEGEMWGEPEALVKDKMFRHPAFAYGESWEDFFVCFLSDLKSNIFVVNFGFGA